MRLAVYTLLLCLSFPALSTDSKSLKAVKQEMINRSINSYSGNCPCPYSVMRNGRSCGGRSAYSRPGGHSPLCYETDITDEQAKFFIKKKR